MKIIQVTRLSLIVFVCLLVLAGCSAGTTPASAPPSPTDPPQIPSPTALPTASPTTPDPTPTSKPFPTASPSATPEMAVSTLPVPCVATQPDMLGPFYTPGAPERTSVGEGYLLSGVVRSATDCHPIPGAQIEFWMAGPNGEYTDEFRATAFADEQGYYLFESHFPPPYSGRPPHIHLRASAPGFETLVTQHYPQPGITEATFDLVLLAN